MLDIETAQYIAQEMNRRIADILQAEVKLVRFDFIPLIERKLSMKNGQIVERIIRGRCFVNESRIEIVGDGNWGTTLIEELIHLYRPSIRHQQVKRLVRQSVLYLKAMRQEIPRGRDT